MENPFDFLINFKSVAPTPEVHEKEELQETESYIEITQDGKRSYRCTHPDCSKIFRYKSEANRHIIIHRKGKPYSCSFVGCKKSFKRAETLEEHLRIHEEDLPFSCNKPGCDRRFVSKPALRYHQLRHSNNREFKCDIEGCKKSFLTMQHLKQHQSCGLHCSKSPSESSENNKSYKKFKNDSESDVSESVGKASKCNEREEKIQHMSELLHVIQEENQILKEKLERVEKVQVYSEESHCSFQYTHQILFSDLEKSGSFIDKYELKVLEFLNEKEKNYF